MVNTKMKLKKLIKKINKENAPPGGWNSSDKLQAASLKQAIQETVPWNEVLESASFKRQASKASSSKLQAPKRKP
jgi:hypothetical protein